MKFDYDDHVVNEEDGPDDVTNYDGPDDVINEDVHCATFTFIMSIFIFECFKNHYSSKSNTLQNNNVIKIDVFQQNL